MNSKEIEKILKKDGWKMIKQVGSHRQYRHKSKPGKETVPFHGRKELDVKTTESIFRQAGIRYPSRYERRLYYEIIISGSFYNVRRW